MSTASDLFDGLAQPVLDEHYGETVTYHRGNDSVSLTMVPSALDDEAVSEELGPIVTREYRDWSGAAADIKPAGSAVEPKRGDLIKHAVGGTTYVYEVVLPPGGSRHWDWSDSVYTRRRIHTKLIGTE